MRTFTCPAAASTFELTTQGPVAATLAAAIPFNAERRVTAAGFADCFFMMPPSFAKCASVGVGMYRGSGAAAGAYRPCRGRPSRGAFQRSAGSSSRMDWPPARESRTSWLASACPTCEVRKFTGR